jgi:peroxiredoxin/outer membrane lipoprotein-sorting protein
MDSSGKSIDPAATTLLDRATDAYAALNGLSMHFVVSNGDSAGSKATSSDISFSRPDKARVENSMDGKKILGIADGSQISMFLTPTTYRVDKATGPEAMLTLLGQIPSAMNSVLPRLVGGKSLLELGFVKWESVSLLPDHGVKMMTHVGKDGPLYTFHLYFDPTDSLLRRVESIVTYRGKTSRNITSITSTVPNPEFAPGTFVFTPPPAAKLYAEPPMYDPKLVVGAVPYALKSKDLNGKTINWKGYKGKAVLLDFWATWCGPCVGELPNVLKAYKTYHPEGFEIVGVSLDSDKKALTDFVKARDLKYPNLFDGQGWKNADAKSYGIQAIPFTLLIGKDGKIAAVNPRGEELEPALKKALAQ